MKNNFNSILAIFFGLIIIIFPIMGIIDINSLISLSILLFSIYLLITGVAIIDYKKSGAILDLIVGVLLLLLSILLIYDPKALGFLAEITVYLAGIMLIIVGIISLVNNRESRFSFYIGIAGAVLGLLYIIIGTYVSDPTVLGILIGLWLIIAGVLRLMDR